jgi:hypothetical protein
MPTPADAPYKKIQRDLEARYRATNLAYASGMGKRARISILRTNPLATFTIPRPAQRFVRDDGRPAYRPWPRNSPMSRKVFS